MDSASTSTSVELLMLEKDGNGLQWIPMPSIKVGRRRFAAFATNTTTKRGILVVGGRDNEHDSLCTMEFLQEPSKDDIVYWSLLNPPPLEKPALATETDTTIHEHTQSEEWIQDLIRQKDGYQNQVLSAILEIRFVSVWTTPLLLLLQNNWRYRPRNESSVSIRSSTSFSPQSAGRST